MENISNNPEAIVAICIFGSGFVICAGLGMSRMLVDSDNGVKDRSDAQRLYMSEVRRRHMEMLENEV
jgi:hypothetical protein